MADIENQQAPNEVTTMKIRTRMQTDQQTSESEEAGFKQRVESLLVCSVCNETVTDPKALNCGHFYCAECINLLNNEDESIECSICHERTPITDEGLKDHYLAKQLLEVLEHFSANTTREIEDQGRESPAINGVTNGINGLSDHESETESIHEGGDEMKDIAAVPDVDAEPTLRPPVEDAQNQPNGEQTSQQATSTEVVAEVHSDPENDNGYPSPLIRPIEQDTTSESDNMDAERTQEAISDTPPAKEEPPDITVNSAATETVTPQLSEPESNSPTPTVPPQPESQEVKEVAADETDRKAKPSEIKPSDVSVSINNQKQCGDCHSKDCTCNCSSTLLTPVSMGSSLSVEQNVSTPPSEVDETEIYIRKISSWTVDESASHIEVANKSRIHVTRWTYDDNGAIATFDGSGKKVKFVHGTKNNYSGIAFSNNSLYALNTNKGRIEKYSGTDGKKEKHIKLESCRDPHAIDIMPSGQILVIDQDRNSVIAYPNTKGSKIKTIKHDLMKQPYDIACVDDAFYVTCATTQCILKLDLDGKLLWSSCETPKESKTKLKVPQGICVDEGKLYVVDRGNRCVLVFDNKGILQGKLCDREAANTRKPWYISVRDKTIAILYDHNVVKTYELV